MTVDFIFNLLSQFLSGFLSSDLLLILSMLLPFFALFGFITIYGFGVIYAELKVSSFIQDKTGPMGQGYGFHAGKWGLLQPVADGLHLFFKEDIIPSTADRPLFILAPFLIFIGMFVGIIAIPFGEAIIISDMNIGIFYILGIGSLAVIALILAGWSSNNKWSLYGAMRAAAQIISYEIPIGLSFLLPVIVAGSLNLGDIVSWQADNRWFILHSPFTFVAFAIFFISVVAETNRVPFDIPEAESELVAGWMTEYSGFKWAIFFLSEYANMLVVSLVASIIFLGGWLSPFTLFNVLPDKWLFLDGPIFGFFWLLIKAVLLIFIMMWFRWTFPRLRVDQLMYLCWKVFIPFSLANLFFISIWELIF